MTSPKNVPFVGCAPALVTPFNAQGVDVPALHKLVNQQIAGGVAALVACGTTGEPSTMTEDEWALVVAETVKAANGRVHVIAGTGGNNTQHVIALAHKAKALGAAAQLCVTPYYNKTTQAGLIAHYRAIAEAVDLPIIIYNVPGRTGLSIQPQTLAVLSDHPNIVAIKEASGDFSAIAEMMSLTGDRIAYYSGNDDQIVPLMALGGLGVISVLSNIAPRQTVKLCQDMLQGRPEEAAAIQKRLMPLIKALFVEVNPIPVKAGLAMMGVMADTPRLPLVPMSDKNRALLEAAMQAEGLL